jgi:hypothetical protein
MARFGRAAKGTKNERGNGEVELAAAITALRKELVKAQLEGESESLRFRADRVELEFEFTVEKDVSADTGVRFYVVSLGAKGGVRSEKTHSVKLSLKPLTGQASPDVENPYFVAF